MPRRRDSRASRGSRRASRRDRRSSPTTCEQCGPARRPRGARLQRRRLRLHHVHRQLRPAARRRSPTAVRDSELVACAVLSGNRNFEGRIHPQVRDELPRVAAARRRVRDRRHDATSISRRSRSAPAGRQAGLSCATSGRRTRRSELIAQARRLRACSKRATRASSPATRTGRRCRSPHGDIFTWDPTTRPTCKQPALLRRHDATTGTPSATSAARACSRARRLASRPTTSRPPAPSRTTSPAGSISSSIGVQPKDFNSYGARRGNHEVMVRGTFANIRLQEPLVPGIEGGVTSTCPSGEQMSHLRRRDALPSGRACRSIDPRRQGIRHRLLARLGREGHDAARRAAP